MWISWINYHLKMMSMLKIMRGASIKVNNLWIKLKKLNKMMMIGMEPPYLVWNNSGKNIKDHP